MKVRATTDGLEFTGDTANGDSILEITLGSVGDKDIDEENKQWWAKVIQDMIDHSYPL